MQTDIASQCGLLYAELCMLLGMAVPQHIARGGSWCGEHNARMRLCPLVGAAGARGERAACLVDPSSCRLWAARKSSMTCATTQLHGDREIGGNIWSGQALEGRGCAEARWGSCNITPWLQAPCVAAPGAVAAVRWEGASCPWGTTAFWCSAGDGDLLGPGGGQPASEFLGPEISALVV
jgi:hypothetical protein